MPNLTSYEVTITIIVLLWVVKQLFDLMKNKKEPEKAPEKAFICHAENKDVTNLKSQNESVQHEKMIETLGKMNVSLELMNATTISINGKTARTESHVEAIRAVTDKI